MYTVCFIFNDLMETIKIPAPPRTGEYIQLENGLVFKVGMILYTQDFERITIEVEPCLPRKNPVT